MSNIECKEITRAKEIVINLLSRSKYGFNYMDHYNLSFSNLKKEELNDLLDKLNDQENHFTAYSNFERWKERILNEAQYTKCNKTSSEYDQKLDLIDYINTHADKSVISNVILKKDLINEIGCIDMEFNFPEKVTELFMKFNFYQIKALCSRDVRTMTSILVAVQEVKDKIDIYISSLTKQELSLAYLEITHYIIDPYENYGYLTLKNHIRQILKNRKLYKA